MQMESVMLPTMTEPEQLQGNVRLYNWFERLYIMLFGCFMHDWSRPFVSKEFRYPRPYNAHECCMECGKMRLYNLNTMQGGDLFKVVS